MAFILSLVVLALSIAPCCALGNEEKPTKAQTTVKQQNEAQDEDCCHDCAPFYTCGTCAGFIVMPLTCFNAPSSMLIAQLFNPSYLQSFTAVITQNIWQPPKLS